MELIAANDFSIDSIKALGSFNKLYLLVSAVDPQESGVKCYYVSLPLPSWRPQPPNTASGSGGALELPQRVRAEPGRQTVSGAF